MSVEVRNVENEHFCAGKTRLDLTTHAKKLSKDILTYTSTQSIVVIIVELYVDRKTIFWKRAAAILWKVFRPKNVP